MTRATMTIIAIVTAFLLGVQLAAYVSTSIAWTVWAVLILIAAVICILKK